MARAWEEMGRLLDALEAARRANRSDCILRRVLRNSAAYHRASRFKRLLNRSRRRGLKNGKNRVCPGGLAEDPPSHGFLKVGGRCGFDPPSEVVSASSVELVGAPAPASAYRPGDAAGCRMDRG